MRRLGCFEASGAVSDSLFAEEEGKDWYVRGHMQQGGIYHKIQFDMS